jgi:hypothetical protein
MGQVGAVLVEVVQVQGAQGILDVALVGVDRVADQGGQLQRVGLGVFRVAALRTARSCRSREESASRSSVSVMVSTLPAVPERRQPRASAVPSRPSGGEPSASIAEWNRSSEKSLPQEALAWSRIAMISSLPQV